MRLRLIAAIALAGLMAVAAPPTSEADEGSGLRIGDNSVRVRAWKQQQQKKLASPSAGSSSSPPRATSTDSQPKYKYLPKDEYKAQMDSYRRELAAAISANDAAINAQGQCISTPGNLSCGRFRTVPLPDDPNIRQAADPADPAAAPPAPAVTPEQAAYIASARLRLTAPKPVIGPPPEINEWGMAAVGYPLWLWAEGELDPAPVSDSVFDLSVALDARLVEVVFDMGDGNRVRCADLGTRWTRSVEPGATSPSCGYAYQEPSLPEGSYTVRANAVWAIDWSINGTTGSIPFYQSASTDIPVGELQVLVR